jgi:hypothetical protein
VRHRGRHFPEIEPGDIIQAFEMETIAPTL